VHSRYQRRLLDHRFTRGEAPGLTAVLQAVALTAGGRAGARLSSDGREQGPPLKVHDDPAATLSACPRRSASSPSPAWATTSPTLPITNPLVRRPHPPLRIRLTGD
jgi:hypothetical protein